MVLLDYTSINIQFDERVSGGHRNNNRNSESNPERHATSKELYILLFDDQNYSYNIFSHISSNTAVEQLPEFLVCYREVASSNPYFVNFFLVLDH